MKKQITMALTGISLCLAMNDNVQAQELFLDGGTSGIGATTPIGNTGVGVFTNAPLMNYFDVNGDVRLNGSGTDDGVFFASPAGVKGFGIMRSGFTNRADVRFDGNNISMVAGTGTLPPPSFNGITITPDGNSGIGTTTPDNTFQLHVDCGNTLKGNGILSNIDGVVPSIGSEAVAIKGVAKNNGVNVAIEGNAWGEQENYGGQYEAVGGLNNTGVHAFAFGTQAMTAANIGVSAEASVFYDANVNMGVRAHASSFNSTTTRNYGVYASINGGATGNIAGGGSFAGYFDAGAPGNGAGFFRGNVWRTGIDNFTSDQKFKQDIRPIDGALRKIMMLQSKTYTFRTDDFPSLNFDAGVQYGFIAQELEKVIPELVNEGICPAKYDKNGKVQVEEIKFKGVEYVSLIPILTAGIQEQQTIIETQNAKIAGLEERLAKLEQNGTTGIGTSGNHSAVGAALFQNAPNPFGSNTEIRYRLPEQYSDAKIMVFDMNGKQVRTVALQGAGEGSTNFSSGELATGMYMYSLVIDGQEIDTKRMILSGK